MSKNRNVDHVPPNASAMLETLRSSGYSLSTAVADIIDNSITAKAKNIWINLEWNEEDPTSSFIAITDDGVGMSKTKLVNAMRVGSQSPLAKRDKDDLGRFGIGLKSAALSQARRLTVITKNGSKKTVRRWDLDHIAEVEEWELLRKMHSEASDKADQLKARKLKKGTVVLLERLDRILATGISGETPKHDDWLTESGLLREHLEMVFHRFMSRERSKIKMFINDVPLDPWDPFCTEMKATTMLPEHVSKTLGEVVKVRGYILPHRDKFNTDAAHKKYAGPKNWCDQQGFYLYRNNRLLISGDWLGLGGRNGWTQDEHMKLARISIDISNKMDREWKINIMKSSAGVPYAIRPWLTAIAKEIRNDARDVYGHRAGRKKRKRRVNNQSPWKRTESSSGSFIYGLDKNHPIFKALIKSLSEGQTEQFKTLISLIEKSVPVHAIWLDTAERKNVADPFATDSDPHIKKLLKTTFKSLINQGLSVDRAIQQLEDFEPFQSARVSAIMNAMETKLRSLQ